MVFMFFVLLFIGFEQTLNTKINFKYGTCLCNFSLTLSCQLTVEERNGKRVRTLKPIRILIEDLISKNYVLTVTTGSRGEQCSMAGNSRSPLKLKGALPPRS